MDDYFPAIMAVVYGDTLPQLAVARVEEAIELRRTRVNADPADGGTSTAEAATAVLEPMNLELAALLATLSSELDERADPDEHQGDAP
jgi:hypothetical protein